VNRPGRFGVPWHARGQGFESSTGFLVILSAPQVTPAQEALWYAIYAAVLWAIVITVISLQRRLTSPIQARPAAEPAAASR
jgi:hypothetical protein